MSDRMTATKLSNRERQVVALAAQGMTDVGIAHTLGIGEATVKSYWARLRAKLGPGNRAHLVAQAVEFENEETLSELQRQVSELRSTMTKGRRAPSATAELYHELLEQAPDAAILVDNLGRIVWMNKESTKLFGYEREELEGKALGLLVPSSSRAKHGAHIQGYFESPARKEMGNGVLTRALSKQGSEMDIAATLSRIDSALGDVVLCMVRPVIRNSAVAL